MIEKYSTSRIDNKLLVLFSDLSWIKEKIEDFANLPTSEVTEELDQLLARFAHNSEALKNAVTTMVKELSGYVTDENGDMEVDVVPDENGLRI